MSSSDLDKHDTNVANEAEEKSSTTQKRAPESVGTTNGDIEKDIEKQNPDAVHDVEITQTKSDPHGEVDPNIVDFNGPDDPMNPMNWPKKRKWVNGGFLSALTFIT
jgi:hypothetical protein